MRIKPETALISVSNKNGVYELAQMLQKQGTKIISTGGTAKLLKEKGINIIDISDFTGFPEILDGRVKTLNNKVHAGILNIRDNEEHNKIMDEYHLQNIDMVVVNLYPFEETISKDNISLDEAIENIDIGGPTMIRSAAKNYRFVTVVVDKEDYGDIINELNNGGITDNLRFELARKAFTHTCMYDSIISNYFNKLQNIDFPDELVIPARKKQHLRYGENPHQNASYYTHPLISEPSMSTSEQLHGKELSFNNIIDGNAAIEFLKDFDEPAAVIVKHTNPCGAAVYQDIGTAYKLALEGDPVSAFGGIVGVNRIIDVDLAKELKKLFLEIIIAPDFTEEALTILKEKKNLRLISIGTLNKKRDAEFDLKRVTGGLLLQEKDTKNIQDLKTLTVPTKRKPTADEYKAMAFAWKTVKHIKSNAIVYTNSNQIIGVGAGQMSRVDSCKIAAMKAQKSLKNAVMASDAFFPFRDAIDEAASIGISAIIQPGGSIRDGDIIDACNELGLSMVFTGTRHFKH